MNEGSIAADDGDGGEMTRGHTDDELKSSLNCIKIKINSPLDFLSPGRSVCLLGQQ